MMSYVNMLGTLFSGGALESLQALGSKRFGGQPASR